MAKRCALLIANDRFRDADLHPLYAPTDDVISLKKVLEDPDIGDFSVELLINAGLPEARKFVGMHFRDREPDDLVLLYYTGHGLRDDGGDLFLALPNTEVSDPSFDSLDSDFVKRAMQRSRSRRQVLVLDCCHSGAFMAPGARRAKGQNILQPDDFDPGGRGTYVLAASAANKSAFEADGRSIYTKHLVDALSSGCADPDKEVVTVDDLHAYICQKLARQRVPMQPRMWVDEKTEPLVVARSPNIRRPEVVASIPINGLPAVEGSEEASIEDFLGTDPIAGEEAIRPLAAKGSSIVNALLSRSPIGRQQLLRMRKLCALIGEPALPPLVEAIQNEPWVTKLAAAPCFAAFEGNSLAKDLVYGLLKVRDFDVQRLAIEAAGHLGYSSDIRWELVRLAKFDDLHNERLGISSYSFGKLYSFVLESLARGFARTGKAEELRHLSGFLQLCSREEGDDFYAKAAVVKGFEDLTPVAADTLMKDWLPRLDGPYAELALNAVSNLRLRRIASPCVAYLFDQRPEVRVSAGICLGSIGSESAARAVAEALKSSNYTEGVLWAVCMLYEYAVDWSEGGSFVDDILKTDSEVAAMMLVSVALRDSGTAIDRAQEGLNSHNPFWRGASALALAWTRHPDAGDLLRNADCEAATDLERVFVIAAQILAGNRDRGNALHEAQRKLTLWHDLRPFWRYQILAAFRLAADGERRARLWAEISGDDSARIQELVAHFVDRAANDTGTMSR